MNVKLSAHRRYLFRDWRHFRHVKQLFSPAIAEDCVLRLYLKMYRNLNMSLLQRRTNERIGCDQKGMHVIRMVRRAT